MTSPISRESAKNIPTMLYIGSYIKGQEEPLTLPGLLFDPEYAEDGEVLADSMFVELKKN